MSEESPPYVAGQAAGPDGLVWSARPHQIINAPIYAAAVIAAVVLAIALPWPWSAAAAVCALPAGWYYLVGRCTRYEVTAKELRVRHGVFTRRVEEVQLYRVLDTAAAAPLLYRLLGLGNIDVWSNDRTSPLLRLVALADHEPKRRQLRELVERARRAKGTRFIE